MSNYTEANIKVLGLADAHVFETLLKLTDHPKEILDEILEVMAACPPEDFKAFMEQKLPPGIAQSIKQIIADI